MSVSLTIIASHNPFFLNCRSNDVIDWQGFFLEMYFWGGNCFCGERKCEEYPKKQQQNLLLFGGEIQNLRGEISPPKGPEKKTLLTGEGPL